MLRREKNFKSRGNAESVATEMNTAAQSPTLKGLSACVHSEIKKMRFYHSLSCLEPNFNLTAQIL